MVHIYDFKKEEEEEERNDEVRKHTHTHTVYLYAIEKCVANAQYAHMGMGHHNGEIKA